MCINSPIRQSLAMQSRLALYSFLFFAFIYFRHRGGASCGLCVNSSAHTSLCVCVQAYVRVACVHTRVCVFVFRRAWGQLESLFSPLTMWFLGQLGLSACLPYPGLEFLVFSLHIIASVGIIMQVPGLKVPLSAKTVIILPLLSNYGMLFM